MINLKKGGISDMLMDIKCESISSVMVHLKFDDGSTKDKLVAIGDLIDVTYNANGIRKRIVGRAIAISTVGTDPKGWYIIVDGSDDFASQQARFSPMSILDLEIVRRAASMEFITTPLGEYGAPYLRIVKGRLQYSTDGTTWLPIVIDSENVIEDIEG